MKCGYSYESMKAIFLAMLGREVDRKDIDLDAAKIAAHQFYLFCSLLTDDKQFVQELKEEGLRALKDAPTNPW